MDKLLTFCAALTQRHVHYDMLVAREEAVMITIVSPGAYLEIEFFDDGTVEIERFSSHGVEAASDAELDELLSDLCE